MSAPHAPGTVRNLRCCCCDESAGRWAQHRDRDTGFGLCVSCARRLRLTEPAHEMLARYGVPGVNYEDPGPLPEVTARAVVVELYTIAGRVPGYSMIDGPSQGAAFIAHDYRAAWPLMGREVHATYQPGERFARLATPPE